MFNPTMPRTLKSNRGWGRGPRKLHTDHFHYKACTTYGNVKCIQISVRKLEEGDLFGRLMHGEKVRLMAYNSDPYWTVRIMAQIFLYY
jgi:hypothetical protein